MLLKTDNDHSLNLFCYIIRKILFLWQPLHCTGTSRYNVKIDYRSPYLKEIGYYKEASTDLIGRAINNCMQGKNFSRTFVNEKVSN